MVCIPYLLCVTVVLQCFSLPFYFMCFNKAIFFAAMAVSLLCNLYSYSSLISVTEKASEMYAPSLLP